MLRKLLSTNTDNIQASIAILLLRLGAGAFLWTHGIPKLMKVMGGDFRFLDPIGLGPEASLILSTFAEFGCVIFIFLGFGTRLAAIPLVINMSVISFFQHAADPFSIKELPLLYLLAFLTILITGAGKFSLDHKLFNKKERGFQPVST